MQMRMLKAAGYVAITFAQLVAAMNANAPLPLRPILLTFDDGYANLVTNVHPLLQKLNFAYTVFLVPQHIGGTNAWVAAEGYEPTPLMDWPGILALQADGVTFGAHTMTHPRLTDLTLDAARQEIAASKDVCEQHLGREVSTFCYPYGAVNGAVADAVRDAGFTHAVTTQTGRVRASDDPLTLPRLSVMHVPPVSLTYGVGPLNFWWRVLLWRDKRSA